MTEHPEPKVLRAYAAGTLAAREAITVDAHLNGCADCRKTLAASASGEASTIASARMLRRIERAGGHLAYEELSALVDGKMARERMPAIETHLSACGRCRRELADMRAFAPALAKPLPKAEPATAGWFDSVREWFAVAPATRGIAAAVVAAFAASLVMSARLGPAGPHDPAEGSTTSASVGTAETPLPAGASLGHDVFDRGVFERLDRFAPEASSAARSGDLVALARAIKARADQGNPSALQAYALLLAEGRGVTEDRATAIALLKRAAAANDPGAARNLEVLQRPAAAGSYSR